MTQSPQAPRYHSEETSSVLSSLETTRQGLSQSEAEERLRRYGPNELVEKGKISPFRLWLEQFKDFLIIILLIAVVLSAILGETVDALVIFVIILFATTLGFFQEYRAERAMEALKRMAAPKASVIRDGNEQEPTGASVTGSRTSVRKRSSLICKLPGSFAHVEAIIPAVSVVPMKSPRWALNPVSITVFVDGMQAPGSPATTILFILDAVARFVPSCFAT